MPRLDAADVFTALSVSDDVIAATSVFRPTACHGLLRYVAATIAKESLMPSFNAAWTFHIVRGALEKSVVGSLLSDKAQVHLANVMAAVVQPFVERALTVKS